MARPQEGMSAAEEIAGACVAVRVRAIHRAISALYDDALRPLGLRVGQLNLLVAVARMGTARPADLCRALLMGKSTLSRDAQVLRRDGLLESDPGAGDGRSRPLRLSPRGLALLDEALPAWRLAQAKALRLLGDESVSALRGMTSALRNPESAGRGPA